MQRNTNIYLVNSMSICEGIITRQRVTEKLNEKSVIDVFLVCGKLLPYIRKLKIDEKRENPLTNYHALRKGLNLTESDHNKLELFLNIETPQIKPIREEFFNFKSAVGQKRFLEMTNNSEKLRKCFKTNQDFGKQAANFESTLNGVFHQSFQKIRGKKRKQEKSEVQGFMQDRKRLKSEMKTNPTIEVQNHLGQGEENISHFLSNKNRNRVNDILQKMANSDNSCNTLGMWKQVKKMFQKILKNVPIGVRNHKGKIITKSSVVKQIVVRKYQQRLRKRPANPNIEHLLKIKEENARRLINIAKTVKTPPCTGWSLIDF